MGKLITTGYHLPYDSDLVERSRNMRNEPTFEEGRLWSYCLRGVKPPFYRQRPIGHYIVDFYSPARKLVIEVDGDSHFDERGMAYDKQRTEFLEGYGLMVLRFTNVDVERNLSGVKQRIDEFLALKNLPPLVKGVRGYRI